MIRSRGKMLKVTWRKAQAAATDATSISSETSFCDPSTAGNSLTNTFVCSKMRNTGSQIKKIMQNKNEVTLATDIGCLDHTNCKRKRGSIALIICCSKSGLRAFSNGSSPTAISSSPRIESTVQNHKYVSVTLWKKQWWVKINYRYLGKEYNLGTKSLK